MCAKSARNMGGFTSPCAGRNVRESVVGAWIALVASAGELGIERHRAGALEQQVGAGQDYQHCERHHEGWLWARDDDARVCG